MRLNAGGFAQLTSPPAYLSVSAALAAPPNMPFGDAGWSIAFWFRCQSPITAGAVISLGDFTRRFRQLTIGVLTSPSNTLSAFFGASYALTYNAGGKNIPLTTWHHLAVVHSASYPPSLEMWLNATLVATMNLPTALDLQASSFRVGSVPSNTYQGFGAFNGWLDDLLIVSAPFTAAQIALAMR